MAKHMQSKRRMDKGKVLRGDDGKMYRMTQILFCEMVDDDTCRALIHHRGWTTFSGRSLERLPPAKFNHCRSKFKAAVRTEA
jgi:hypothetical protein